MNYLDRELRTNLHEHVRETVCFGRNVNSRMERLALYLFAQNHRKRFRISMITGATPRLRDSRLH